MRTKFLGTDGKKLKRFPFYLVLLIIVGLIYGFFDDGLAPQTDASVSAMVVRVLDVGQGASTLVSMGDTHILVDAGNTYEGSQVVSILEALGIDRLTLVVGSHPHSDHIGGMPALLSEVSCDLYWMPDVVSSSNLFNQVLNLLDQKDIPLDTPSAGHQESFGDLNITVLSPSETDPDDLNNSSMVLRITSLYGSVLLPGDIEKATEEKILDSGVRLSSDIMVAAHHGSRTGNTSAFLNAVHPTYIAIPVGSNNTYGHPHTEMLDRLRNAAITAYRTDQNGNITFICNASGITVETEK